MLAANSVFRIPARNDLARDEIPAWLETVMRDMKVAPVDWALLARDGSAWMAYWDQHVRGTGKRLEAND